MQSLLRVFFGCLLSLATAPTVRAAGPNVPLRAGAAAVDVQADDDMIIGGGIGPGKASGQEGKLRAVAVVLHGPPGVKLAIVACDALMIERDVLDKACQEIESRIGLPARNILINCTHTHHAPTTCTVHGYVRDEVFTERFRKAIVQAVQLADERLSQDGQVEMLFCLGEESSVGQNSRLLLKDNAIFWVGSRDDAVRPTGPFDPQLPVLAFVKKSNAKPAAILFNHSTHTIGVRTPGKRSPSFYGLAAQELEDQHGGVCLFLEGASGSTHNLTVACDEMTTRIKDSVNRSLQASSILPMKRLASIKREIPVRRRLFDELEEDEKVRSYCTKRMPDPKGAAYTIDVFRKMRRRLAPLQGKTRNTYVQTMLIGDVAIVGVPGEFFTRLGMEIKRKSPYRYTYVAELANDWVGYIPDEEAYGLGGYQVWTGLHSYVAKGTGEQIVDEAVRQLQELADSTPADPPGTRVGDGGARGPESRAGGSGR